MSCMELWSNKAIDNGDLVLKILAKHRIRHKNVDPDVKQTHEYEEEK